MDVFVRCAEYTYVFVPVYNKSNIALQCYRNRFYHCIRLYGNIFYFFRFQRWLEDKRYNDTTWPKHTNTPIRSSNRRNFIKESGIFLNKIREEENRIAFDKNNWPGHDSSHIDILVLIRINHTWNILYILNDYVLVMLYGNSISIWPHHRVFGANFCSVRCLLRAQHSWGGSEQLALAWGCRPSNRINGMKILPIIYLISSTMVVVVAGRRHHRPISAFL